MNEQVDEPKFHISKDWRKLTPEQKLESMREEYKKILSHPRCDDYRQRFNAALADDLNTPKAFSVLHAIATDINKCNHPLEKLGLQHCLKELMQVLGFK